jgi:hypothetical protein
MFSYLLIKASRCNGLVSMTNMPLILRLASDPIREIVTWRQAFSVMLGYRCYFNQTGNVMSLANIFHLDRWTKHCHNLRIMKLGEINCKL